MLPNWLYGKSKTKLASILGGGGGAPADYNQVKEQVNQNKLDIAQNTEDILQLSDALDSKASFTQISNPNILHNPWFTVNQRDATSLSSSGKIADRWGVTANGSWTVTRTAEGYLDIDNSNNENTLYLLQKRTLTYLTSLRGYPLTASVMFSDGTIVSGTKPTSEGTIYINNDDIIVSRNYQSEIFNVNVKPGKHVIIKALKLEVGEISTLHLDPRPEYALELAKCQRYFQNIVNTDASNNRLIGIAYAVSTTSARILLTLPDHMRTNSPTITTSGSFLIQPITGGLGIDVTSIASLGLMETYINIKADVASGLTAGTTYFFQMKPDAAINFDAEL